MYSVPTEHSEQFAAKSQCSSKRNLIFSNNVLVAVSKQKRISLFAATVLHFSIFPLFHILCLSAAAKCHGTISWLSVISLTAHNLHVDGKGYWGYGIRNTEYRIQIQIQMLMQIQIRDDDERWGALGK